MMKREAYPGTQAVLRAMTLLKAFAADRAELRLVELTRICGLNKTTAYRLLTALESAGMIERTPGADAYRLGPELMALGSLALGSSGLRLASRATLQSLAVETRETATLEVLVDDQVLILDEVMGSHVIGALPSLGTRWPVHTTSTGKVLLAFLPEEERDRHLAPRLPAATPRTITSRQGFSRELERVIELGYGLNDEELEAGYVAASAPVRSVDGQVVGAISVGGPKSRLDPDRLTRIARSLPAAAEQVSRRLGWTTPAPRSRLATRPRP
jgi:IclR family acetate operon transcriptional repressor